jgi:hypothetical protein
VCGSGATTALAQRGVGESSGIARQAVKPEVVTLSGKFLEIKTGPCEKTTGHAVVGTHLIVQTKEGDKFNVHLGPTAAIAEKVSKLTVGQKLSVKAFRTDKMPEKHYSAQSIRAGKTMLEFRDANLRPVWAGPDGGRGRAARSQGDDAKDTSPAPASASRGRQGGGPPPWAGDGQGHSGRGPDAMFQADREIFHSLLEDHKQTHRTVTKRPDGVETLTESDDPNVALAIQGHAAAMHDRVKKILPIHMRDPLFAAVFGHATKIKMEIKNTAKGVRVVETSSDPYAVQLIQAHAAVVDLFVAHGFDEARKNHAVPKQDR